LLALTATKKVGLLNNDDSVAVKLIAADTFTVDFCREFDVSKFPTLRHVRKAVKHRREYRGQRSREALISHVRRLAQDPVVLCQTNEEFTSHVTAEKAALLAFFTQPPNQTSEYESFKAVAQTLRDECDFFWINGQAGVSNSAAGRVNYIAFRPTKEVSGAHDETFEGQLKDELQTWATRRCVPIVREITFDNAEELTEERLPFVILFYLRQHQDSVREYKTMVERELMHEHGKVNFLIADGHKFAHPLTHLGKSKEDMPLIAIDSFQHMFLFPKYEQIRYVRMQIALFI
jgi:endoplasmic reticulum resident protein 44